MSAYPPDGTEVGTFHVLYRRTADDSLRFIEVQWTGEAWRSEGLLGGGEIQSPASLAQLKWHYYGPAITRPLHQYECDLKRVLFKGDEIELTFYHAETGQTFRIPAPAPMTVVWKHLHETGARFIIREGQLLNIIPAQ